MYKRAGFERRLGAALIDVVVITILGALFGRILESALGAGAGADAVAEAAAAVWFFGAMVLGVYFVGVLYGLVEALTGASPGKMLLKLKIGFEDGRNAHVAVYFTRWAVKYSGPILVFLGLITGNSFVGKLGLLAFFVIFVGCFFVLAAKKQAIHDMAAKTAVFNKADLV